MNHYLTGILTLIVASGLAARAQALDFVIDPNQSSVVLGMTLNGNLADSGISAVSGTVSADFDSLKDPFETATITALDITLDDGLALSFDLARDLTIDVTTADGDISFTQSVPGSINNPVDSPGVFSQLGNTTAGSGKISLTNIGQSVHLSTVGKVSVDYNRVNVARLGDTLVMTVPITGVIPQQTIAPFTLDTTINGAFVATALVPEPGSLALLGLGGLLVTRRRRE